MRFKHKPMRILHIINSLRFGGAERIVLSLVRELSKRCNGTSIEVCTLARGGRWEQELKSCGVVVHSFGINELNAFGAISNLYRLIKDRGYDIVHAHLWPTLYYVSAIRPFVSRTAFVFTEHNTWNRRRNHSVFRVFESIAYKSYDLLVANSMETKMALESWIPQLQNKISIIENGVEIPKNRKESYGLTRPVCLLTVGRLVRQKGVDIAIAALRNLVAEGEEVKLTVVGDGAERLALEKQASDLPVEFIGFHPEPDSLMANHDIFLMPSRWEGFGLTAIEAALVGIPVIASSIDALRRLVSDDETGVLFKVGSSTELARKIKNLVTNPDRRSEMALANRQQALRRWTIQKFAKDTMASYRDLCNTDQPPTAEGKTELTN